MKIKVSVRMMRLRFQHCEKNYINKICKGRCCKQRNESKITILDEEIKGIESRGGVVKDNRLQLNASGQCPFQIGGLCILHETPYYPFGCSISPFALNKNNTLIVRHRYISMGCYNTIKALPVYKAQFWSLKHIFGDETKKLVDKIRRAKEDFFVEVPDEVFNKMKHKEIYLKDQLTMKGVL